MTFDRANPLGWALFEDLTSAQMNIIDTNQSRAIDGTFGGSYNPSGVINIDGTMSVTNLNVTNMSVENATFSGTGTFNAGEINCYRLNCSLQFNCSGEANFNYYTFFKDDVRMTAGSFFFASPESFNINGGLFVVFGDGYARFETEVEFMGTSVTTFMASSQLKIYGSVTFYSGSTLNIASSTSFTTRPLFNDGITFPAGELINYSTEKAFIVRMPWALGTAPGDLATTHFMMNDSYNCWMQKNNASTPPPFATYTQGLWGGTAVTITSVEFRAQGYGLSGAITNPTSYQVKLMNEDGGIESTLGTAVDTNANNNSNHPAVTGTINAAYNPTMYYLGFVFYGYNGGVSLNGTTAFYMLKSVRINMKTSAKGVY